MAQTTLVQIGNGLKATLGTIANLTAYAVEPASPKYPAAWPFFREPAGEFHQTFDGKLIWHFYVTVAVLAADLGQAQTNLLPYLAADGAKSVIDTLEADPTLGGLAGVHATVQRVERVGPIQAGGNAVWGAVISVDVMA